MTSVDDHLARVLDGIEPLPDFPQPLMDALGSAVAEDVVAPIMPRPQVIDSTALTIGYAGVYGTFFLFAKRAAEKYGVDSREILLELGRRGVIGGQEDMIIDVAAEMAGKSGVTIGAGVGA
jgi:4-hydroxy 2-oxovalerate aldolase